jgi:tetratricopeptide (TPR) repeat protein
MRRLLLPWITGAVVGLLSVGHASPGVEEQATQDYRRAEVLRLAGRFEEAISGYRHTLQVFPEHPTAFDRLREVYNRIHTLAVARELLEATVARQEDDFIAWNLLGVLYGRDRRWDEALQAFARSLDAQPRAADPLVNRGWVLLELRRYEDAVTAFEAALALQPRMARAHAGLGSTVVEARGDYHEGMSRYLTAVRLDPENAALLNDLGWLSYKMNRYPEAVLALEKAAVLDPRNPMIATNLGLAYQKAGRGEEAIARLERALAINPEYTLALYGLGKAHESRGQYPEALQAYRRAWRQSGNDLYLLLWLQAYMASHGQVMILFLFVFVVAIAAIVLRTLRGRRTPATEKG